MNYVSIENATWESIDQALDEAFAVVKIPQSDVPANPTTRVTLDTYVECFESGMTPRETADRLEINYGAAYQGLKRAAVFLGESNG